MDSAQIIGIALFLGAIGVLLLTAFLQSNVVICKPNEIVITSGSQRKGAVGQTVGYRIPPEHCHLFDESGKAFARPPQAATAMKVGANQEAPVIFAERAAARVTH